MLTSFIMDLSIFSRDFMIREYENNTRGLTSMRNEKIVLFFHRLVSINIISSNALKSNNFAFVFYPNINMVMILIN